jgi:hypothetical protein
MRAVNRVNRAAAVRNLSGRSSEGGPRSGPDERFCLYGPIGSTDNVIEILL